MKPINTRKEYMVATRRYAELRVIDRADDSGLVAQLKKEIDDYRKRRDGAKVKSRGKRRR